MFENRIIPYILISLSFFYLLIGFNQDINIYDEGSFVYGATRVLNGDFPYRDFWTLYTPAQFYMLGGLFKLFGASIIVERFWSTIIIFVLSLTVYLVNRKLVSQKIALTTWFLMVILIGEYEFFANAMPSALLFSLLSSLCLLNFLFQRHRIWLILSGLSVSAATLFRQDLGFYTFISEILVIIPFVFINLTLKEMSILNRFLKVVKVVFPYLLGMVGTLLPAFIYFLSVVSLDEIRYAFVTYPLTIWANVRSLPYPTPIPNPIHLFTGVLSPISYANSFLDHVPFYFPLLIYTVAIITLIIRICKGRVDWKQIEVWSIILFILLGVTFFNCARVRSDFPHLLPTLIPAVILFGVFLSNIPHIGKFHSVLLLLAFLIGFFIVIKPIYEKTHIMVKSFFQPPPFSFDLDRCRGIYCDQNGLTYQKAIKYIQRNVPEGEKIFIGNIRHDRTRVTDIMFYFLSNRHSATKYYLLEPGFATLTTVQKKIINDIEMQQVRYIVLRNDNVEEPNESSKSSGIRNLDNFIQDKFILVQQFGDYTIWKRKKS